MSKQENPTKSKHFVTGGILGQHLSTWRQGTDILPSPNSFWSMSRTMTQQTKLTTRPLWSWQQEGVTGRFVDCSSWGPKWDRIGARNVFETNHIMSENHDRHYPDGSQPMIKGTNQCPGDILTPRVNIGPKWTSSYNETINVCLLSLWPRRTQAKSWAVMIHFPY